MSWAAQQLAEFLDDVARAEDAAEAARRGVERAAEAVSAECAALLRGGTIVASIGWPRFEIPERALHDLTRGVDAEIAVPGFEVTRAICVQLQDADAHLILVRAGEPFVRDEETLLRGMARSLALTIRLQRTVEAERGLRTRADLQAAENVRLLERLRRRQRIGEAMPRIQRAISRREPLQGVLETIVGAAGELLGDDAPALLLVDPDDPRWLVVAAARGYDEDIMRAERRRRVGEGLGGRAVSEGRLVVSEDYASSGDAMGRFVDHGVRAAMAAPVHEDGRVIGSLIL